MENHTCGVNQESGFVDKSLFARSSQDFSVIIKSNQVSGGCVRMPSRRDLPRRYEAQPSP